MEATDDEEDGTFTRPCWNRGRGQAGEAYRIKIRNGNILI